MKYRFDAIAHQLTHNGNPYPYALWTGGPSYKCGRLRLVT